MEHRKHFRFAVHFRSSFRSTNLIAGNGILNDLSIQGCKISSPITVLPGTVVELDIAPSEAEEPIRISHAVARWSREGTFGLEFTDIAHREWVKLQRLVKDLEKDPYQRATKREKAAEANTEAVS